MRRVWFFLGLMVALGVACSDDESTSGGGAAGEAGAGEEGGRTAGTAGAEQGGEASGGESGGASGGSTPRGGSAGSSAGAANGGENAGGDAGPGGDAGMGPSAGHGGRAGDTGGEGGDAGGVSSSCNPPRTVEGECRVDAECEYDRRCVGPRTVPRCVRIGDGCDEHADCPAGTYCRERACVAAPPVGQPCSPGDRCAVGAYCGRPVILLETDSIPDNPREGVHTDDPVMCRPLIATREPCVRNFGHECAGGVCVHNLLDEGDECTEPQSTEGPHGPLNGWRMCPHTPCIDSLFCYMESNSRASYCLPYVQLGGRCIPPGYGEEERCAKDLFCAVEPDEDEGLCRELPGACEPCAPAGSVTSLARCASGNECVDGVCVRLAELGERCDQNECGPGLVCILTPEQGRCGPP